MSTSSNIVLAIGPALSKEGQWVSGPTRIFEFAKDCIKASGADVFVVDLSERRRNKKRSVGGFSLLRAWDFVFVLATVFGALLKLKPSVVYLLTGPTLVAFMRDFSIIWLARFFGARVVCHHLGEQYLIRQGMGTALSFIFKRTYQNVDTFVSESSTVADRMKGFISHSRITVLPNGIPEKDFGDFESKEVPDEGAFGVLYLSNMIPSKGYLHLLEATSILARDFGSKSESQLQVTFVGSFVATSDSDSPKNLEHDFLGKIGEAGLEKTVTYEKSVFGERKKELLRKNHVFVLPSNYPLEMQPLSILEAMSFGLVVISCDHKEISTMVSDCENGFLIPFADPPAIADRIKSLMANPSLYSRMSKASVATVETSFSADAYGNSLTSLITNPMSC